MIGRLFGTASALLLVSGCNAAPDNGALAEAEARRAAIDAKAAELKRQKEVDGRGGLEPVRYDDWEVKGIASDF